MTDRQAISDESFRSFLVDALRSAGELLILVCYAQSAGLKEWFLARDVGELDEVLVRIPTTGRSGYSDRIEVYATGELPFRAAANDEFLRQKAVDLLVQTGGVLLACRLDGDPELQDVEAVAEVEDVDEWFSGDCVGERLVGQHPFRHDNDADASAFVAYNQGANGAIRPGAY